MKILLIFAALLALTSASVVPQNAENIASRQERFVDGIVIAALEALSEQLRDAGLDPINFDGVAAEFELPVPTILSFDFFLRNLRVTGISNIVINSISYGLINQRLVMDISLPEIGISIGEAAFDITILGHNFVGQTTSRLAIIEPRISGVVQINLLGAIIGNLITSIDLEFDLETIRFDGDLLYQGVNYAAAVNNFVSVTIINAVQGVRAELNELVEIIAWQLVDSIL